jgi:uridine kinase
VDRRRPLTAPATFDGLAGHVLAAPPRLGGVRLVCVDGPAGSGKTTFAGRLTDALGDGAGLVHLEDLYAGWTVTGAVARLSAGVLRPLAEGRPGAFHRYDWAAGRFAGEPVAVPVPRVLVVEGCGSSPRSLDRWTTLRVWLEAPAPLRLSRGLARDGADQAPHWRRWQESEARHFAAEGTRDRADVRIDGAFPIVLPDGAFAVLP